MANRNRPASAARTHAAPARAVFNPVRWLGYLLGCVVAGVVAMQLYFFVQIASWQYLNPTTTTFMRAERWRLCGINVWSCGLDRQWVPYDRISRNLKRAVIASEDADFVNHPGYELDAMLDAWERNKKRGRIVRGGSTITQQLAKNLFLSSEQHYLRKGQELAITWMLEFWLDKQRIYEIYLNSVEWGEGVFGAQAAAQHYFRTSADKLSVGQSARLAAALPAPKCFDKKEYCANVRVNFRAKAGIIARRMGAATLPD
ncbi:Monofunctional biosynthetic peptidoglycan transglycosylase (Monofunctional TGase) [Cupriavidus taiwanensis]|uniref:Biosynthetic peptidoglycan transglycosylase n=1 Tax=Cupriavidus taiwanensis TaxID=164546 RepID=A0A375IZ68_9BURK|nr:Monofunctional biosynthetic peptidoglycan transglycosylase (Monofunctional TGase) [Cupriavidus taiwanensis]